MKLRTLSATLAVAALLGVGVSGAAGATTTHAHHAHHGIATRVARIEKIAAAGTLPASFSCTKAPADLARIAKVEGRIGAYLPKAEAREAAAQAAGKTAEADAIASRIAKVQKFDAALGTVGALITEKCPS
jgi:hypothetical protein